jgi:hypothetical protein
MVLSLRHFIRKQQPAFVLSRRRSLVAGLPARRPEWMLIYRLSSHGIRSIAIWSLNIQINVLIIQRTTCLHSQRPMLSKPVSPGWQRYCLKMLKRFQMFYGHLKLVFKT